MTAEVTAESTVQSWLSSNRDLDRLDAELLVADVLGCNRARVIAFPEQALARPQLQVLDTLSARLRDREPLAYLLENKEFYGLSLKIDHRVLVPRPETELLVELTLATAPARARILELGTGSGAVAIALKTSRPDLEITAVDLCLDALSVARQNATRHRVDIDLLESDWFGEVNGSFDAIVSNPPYVRCTDPQLGVLQHEPRGALVGGPDGLTAIGAIADKAISFLNPEGILAVEHGHDQGPDVRDLFYGHGFHDVATHADLAGLDRVTTGKRP